ncbi:MAG: tRNA guanosine(34) transglycosylase Tgt [Desulfobacteraceae bacterium]|nr:tRNA guanosine(34) transglycosylase Tgt [Desulfobacteraceae bacterium]
MLTFNLDSTPVSDGPRAGTVHTLHGTIQTPIFMPVGTLGTVKSLSPEDLEENGARIILGNTYHLYLRPGGDIIDLFSGLHDFMQWPHPILTDSGGFQVFSLAKLSKISETGYNFQSHIDGSRHMLTPEASIEMQIRLNSDIMMCLDQCIAYPSDHDQAKSALELTTRWAARCKTTWMNRTDGQNSLFGIVQGGMYKDLRDLSVQQLIDLDFPGYAVGGLSVGEPKPLMMEMAAHTLPQLPADKPRYVMGVGTPEDLVELVTLGADMFDCVMPTRNARNGQLFTRFGTINISNAEHRTAIEPIEEGCTCYTCRKYSRAYLRHLYTCREILAYRLNSIHNVHYYLSLVNQMRLSIVKGEFASFRRDFYRTRKKQ